LSIPDAVSMPAPTPGIGSPTPFDGQAPQFDRRVGLPEGDCRAIAAAVIALAGAGEGARVLEIGAGTGMIGSWFLEHPVRYVGLDRSRGMLEVFRRRPGAGRAGLVQADGARSWPLPAGSARVIFSSRAMHLLPLAHVVDEVFRVAGSAPPPASRGSRGGGGGHGDPNAGGGVCLLGWVERDPESVKARMSREMQRLVRERSFTPRTAGSRRFLAACRERGAAELPRTAVARWPARHSPRQSLDSWRGKLGLGGVVLPPGVQESVLDELEAWARRTFGDLDAESPAEETYVLEGVRLGSTTAGGTPERDSLVAGGGDRIR
jgi:SAM-dependent methyltransferase